jgi:hypothetical protein
VRITNQGSTTADRAQSLGNSIGQSGESFSLLLANASAQQGAPATQTTGLVSTFALPVNAQRESGEEASVSSLLDTIAGPKNTSVDEKARMAGNPANGSAVVLTMQVRPAINAAARLTSGAATRTEKVGASSSETADKVDETLQTPEIRANWSLATLANTSTTFVDQKQTTPTPNSQTEAQTPSGIPVAFQSIARWSDESTPALELPIQPRSNAGTSQRLAVRDERPPMSSTALAAKIAATVILPSAALISNSGATAHALAAQTASVAAQAVTEQTTVRPPTNHDVIAVKASGSSDRTTAMEGKGAAGTQPIGQKADNTQTGNETGAVESESPEPSSAAAEAGIVIQAGACVSDQSVQSLNLSPPSVPQNAARAGQSDAAPASASTASDLTLAKAGDTASLGGSTKSSGSSSAQSSLVDAVTHAAAGSQAGEKPQTDLAAAPANAVKVDAAAGQAMTIVSARTSEPAGASVAHGRDEISANGSHTTDQALDAQTAATAPGQGINTARVIQNMSETEMRVGMHSAEFGDISIRTAISQQQMVAQISVDHTDLGKAISAHIPAMQEKLGGEFGIRAMVEVGQSGMSFSSEGGNSQDRQMKPGGAQGRPLAEASAETAQQSARETVQATAAGAGGYRLDIRA